MDFLISDLTGDLDLGDDNSSGLQLCPTYTREAEQRLFQALNLNLTEWFADITKGIPYIKNPNEEMSESIRYILGDKNPNAAQFAAKVLDAYITSLPFVDSFTSSYTYDAEKREFKYTPLVVANGSPIEIDTVNFKV
ncbi:hypothetical protein S140_165 [Shewanella sp. phage 1/40]|uniref:hypothetical protein n=1 Tax=Shewanella sp. phage 1/40 TaxID=1458860 RepID=UPI0004F91A10|nr:hypothetical protein S140_165 [Shewanella sp. phage 1/40]AHK11572.1 hypothetical protein S140_165 [Shewanella sp. phage 1/40]